MTKPNTSDFTSHNFEHPKPPTQISPLKSDTLHGNLTKTTKDESLSGDLPAKPGMVRLRGNHSQMAALFRLVTHHNLPIDMYTVYKDHRIYEYILIQLTVIFIVCLCVFHVFPFCFC